ncbi:hypothetical protein NEHOM01_1994 [Nematocida homosporus]|uniref:uncharacterized protein n=1 Tax=Nematocida homosporus TaxID=1912981 RepID=UPI00221E504C|nr:uncharacterized protein NEHOM01_1994 [Nematocida homosporus]KAI5187189.1 hypothetical protein NEHOM01_1994 [Nematocida homosporus]
MNKRRHTEDLPQDTENQETETLTGLYEFAIRKARLLMEDEFNQIFISDYNYQTYFEKYYDTNIKEMLLKGYEKQAWLAEIDLCQRSSFADVFMEFRDFVTSRQCQLSLDSNNGPDLLKTDLFDAYTTGETNTTVSLALIKNIEMNVTIRDFILVLEEELGLKDWAVSQHGVHEGFRRTLYVRLEDLSLEEFKEKVQVQLPPGSVVLGQSLPTPTSSSALRESGRQLSDKYTLSSSGVQCQEILKAMSALFKVPEVFETLKGFESRVPVNSVADLYILALRKIFNFCYYCKCKYDNPYEMVTKCGLFHVRSTDKIDTLSFAALERSGAFYAQNRAERFQLINSSVNSAIFSKESSAPNEYVCRYCNKRFASMEYFEKHLERKNHPEYEAYMRLHKGFFAMLASLTYPVIEVVEQKGQALPANLYYYLRPGQPESDQLVSYADLDKKYPILSKKPIAIVESDSEE